MELYAWNAIAVTLRNEIAAAHATAYDVLNEWGVFDRSRREWHVQQLMALEAGIATFERRRRAVRERDSNTPGKKGA